MLVRMLVGDEPALPLRLGEVILVRGRFALDEGALEHAFEGLTRDAAGRKGAAERVRGVAAYRADLGSFEGFAVERAPRHGAAASLFDPLFLKDALATGKQLQIDAHARSVMPDEPFEPAIMVAMSMAQDESIDPRRIDVEQIEVADQHLRGVAKIQQIL